MRKHLKAIFTPFHYLPQYLYTGVVVFWCAIFAIFWLSAPVLIPTPKEVMNQLVFYLGNPETYNDIVSSLILTSTSMGISIVLSCILAYSSVVGIFRPITDFLVKVRYMALMGFIFVFYILLHDGEKVKTASLMFGIMPFFTLSILSVIGKIPQKEFDLWTTLRYSKWEQVFQVIIRGKADAIVDAVRSNFAMAWLMLTITETYSMAQGGIGVLLYKANSKTQVDKIFALQIIIFTLGVTFDYLLKQLRYKLFPYTALAEKK